MKQRIILRYRLKKDVIALDTKNRAIKLKKGTRYWMDKNSGNEKKVLLYKHSEKIGDRRRYKDCIRMNRQDLDEYFEEMKKESIIVNDIEESMKLNESVDYIIEEMKRKGA